MGETDVTFRHLLRGMPRPILRLVFPHLQLEPLGSLDASVDRARQLTVDHLFRVRHGKTESAVHLEIERDWRPNIPHRLFDYASAAVAATRLSVTSVVLLLRPGGTPPRRTGVYRVPGIEGDAFVFHYRVMPLWQLDARSMRTQLGLQAAPFCVAMRGADEGFVRSLTEEVVADRRMAQHDRHSTIQLLYMISAAILGADTARRIFHVESIIQDPSVQELIREWADKGRDEGRAEGERKGRAEGEREGRAEGEREGRAEGERQGRALEARAALCKVLAARSLPVTDDVRARIARESDLARLESWLDAALTASTIGDVFRDG
jgi:hypothetical protein